MISPLPEKPELQGDIVLGGIDEESGGPANSRFLICIPLTGLNDTLCQIELCWEHAARWNRVLVIDTRISGLHCDFWDVFEFHESLEAPTVCRPSERIASQVRQLSTKPRGLSGNPFPKREEVIYRQGDRLTSTGELLRIDMDRDHPEDVLVHVARGGGTASLRLLEKIRLNPRVRRIVREKTKHLPESYVAVHVRNTDIQSAYKAFFKRNREFLDGRNVLVCSDDHEVIRFAHNFLSRSRIFAIDVQRGRLGEPIHNRSNADGEGRDRTIEALVDLAAMANAETILYPLVSHGIPRAPYKAAKSILNHILGRKRLARISGFTQLALELNKNKDLACQFLGERMETTRGSRANA